MSKLDPRVDWLGRIVIGLFLLGASAFGFNINTKFDSMDRSLTAIRQQLKEDAHFKGILEAHLKESERRFEYFERQLERLQRQHVKGK